MNATIKKAISSAVAVSAVCALGTTAFAASEAEYTKNENVYVRLEQDGSVQGTHVVNSFTVTKSGEITDYGDYNTLENLTDLADIESDKTEHTFNAEEGKFYYQGNMTDNELPWVFDITYRLDGDEVEGEELVGAEGDLEINLKIKANPSYEDASFYNADMLQVSFTLDPDLCDEIVAEGATISDAGSDQNITWVVMPGTGADLRIATEVKDFEMDDVSITAAPAAELPHSYADERNDDRMGKTTFMISAEGVSFPEEVFEAVVEEKVGLLEKFKTLFNNFMG